MGVGCCVKSIDYFLGVQILSSISVEDIPKENWEDNMKEFSEDIIYIKPGV